MMQDGTHSFDSTDHEGRAEDRHVKVAHFFLLFCLKHGLHETVRDILSALHARIDVINHATVGVDQALVKLLSAGRHVVWQLLEEGDEVDHVRDRAGAVPIRR